MNRFGTSFDVELQSGFLYLLLDRVDKGGDILITGSLRFVELLLYIIVSFPLCIFQRQVFQFRFQLVKSQLVCQRSIQISCFVRHLYPVFFVACILDLAHHVHTVCNHDQNDAHIFGKREQEIAEVFRFNRRTFGVQFVCFHQSFDDTAYIFAIFGIHILNRQDMCLHDFVKHNADETRTFHSDFFGYDNRRL